MDLIGKLWQSTDYFRAQNVADLQEHIANFGERALVYLPNVTSKVERPWKASPGLAVRDLSGQLNIQVPSGPELMDLREKGFNIGPHAYSKWTGDVIVNSDADAVTLYQMFIGKMPEGHERETMPWLESHLEGYVSSGMSKPAQGDYLEQAKVYLENGGEVPSFNVPSPFGNITAVFNHRLIFSLLSGDRFIHKSQDAAQRFGYRGRTRGEKNGVFDLGNGPGDNNLADAAYHFSMLDESLVSKLGMDQVRPVKIVTHNPNGDRVVGLFDSKNSVMAFFGVANYRSN